MHSSPLCQLSAQYGEDRARYLCLVWTTTMIACLLIASPSLRVITTLGLGTLSVLGLCVHLLYIRSVISHPSLIMKVSCLPLTMTSLFACFKGVSLAVIAFPVAGIYVTSVVMAFLRVMQQGGTITSLWNKLISQPSLVAHPLQEVFLYSNWLRMYVFQGELFHPMPTECDIEKVVIPEGGHIELGIYKPENDETPSCVVLIQCATIQIVDHFLFREKEGGGDYVYSSFLKELRKKRCALVTVNLRGYGNSPGYSTSSTVERDAELVVNHLAAKYSKIPFVFYGFCIGGTWIAPAAAYARSRGLSIRAVILDRTFTTLQHVLKWVPSWIVKLILLCSGAFFDRSTATSGIERVFVIHVSETWRSSPETLFKGGYYITLGKGEGDNIRSEPVRNKICEAIDERLPECC